jgi:protocatechuate 3,4-dioxygenase beta subunit
MQRADPRGCRLPRDLGTLQMQCARRRVLGWLAGGTFMALARSPGAAAGPGGTCTVFPEETNGPFPADGSPSPAGPALNILNRSGIVRRDITRSFGSSTSIASGVPLTLTIALKQASHACSALQAHAVYVWHCDRNGEYSMYAPRLTRENYLRGVQVSDSRGELTFETIFPACYSGRYPHIHMEVYRSSSPAGGQTTAVLTSQLALPREVCAGVYASGPGYRGSLANLAQLGASSDMVFAASTPAQLAAQTPSMSGSIASGLHASAAVVVG